MRYYLVNIRFSNYLLMSSRYDLLRPVLDHLHHFISTHLFVSNCFIVVFLHDQVVHFELSGCPLHDLLLHSAFRDKPVHVDLLFLPDPMRSVDRLQIDLWIPV